MCAGKKSGVLPLSSGLTVLTIVLLAFSLITLSTGAAQSEDTENQISIPKMEEGEDYSYTNEGWVFVRNKPVLKKWCSGFFPPIIPPNPGPCKAESEELVERLEAPSQALKDVEKEPPTDKPTTKKDYVLLDSASDFSVRFNLEKGDKIFETHPLANFVAFYSFGESTRLPGTLEVEVSGYRKKRAMELGNENNLEKVKAEKMVTHGPGQLDCDNCTVSLFSFPYTEEDKEDKLHGPMYVKTVKIKVKPEFSELASDIAQEGLGDEAGSYVGLRNLNLFLDRSSALDSYEWAKEGYFDGNLDDALTLIESAILGDPYSPRMYLLKMNILKKQAEKKQAEEDKQKKMDEAYQTIKRGVQIAEDFPGFIIGVRNKTLADVYMEKARFDYRREQWDKAISMTKKAIGVLAEEEGDIDIDDEGEIIGELPDLRRILPSRYVNLLAKSYLKKYESTDGGDEASFQKAVETTLQAVAESPREALSYVQKFNTRDYREEAISYLDSKLDYISEKTYDLDYTNKIESYVAYFSYASLLYMSGTAQGEPDENKLLKSYSAIQFVKKMEIKTEQANFVKALESKVREGLRIQSEDPGNLEKEACGFFQNEPINYADWIDFLSCKSKGEGDG